MTTKRVGIIDYGMGNLASIRNALHYNGHEAEILQKPDALADCDKLILPGVGAFGPAMEALFRRGFDNAIRQFVFQGNGHILGICLGLQLLLTRSAEEGDHLGLDLIPGEVASLSPTAAGRPVPHIGWSSIAVTRDEPLLAGIEADRDSFYFMHSYFCRTADRETVAGTLDYGTECDVVLSAGPVLGCQFHPEKSQRSGLRLLKNFMEMT